MTVLPSAIWTSLCLPGLHPASVCATIWAAVLVVWTGIGSLLACDLGAVPLACYSASCGALTEGLFSGGGLLIEGVLLVVAAVSAVVALTLGVPEPSLLPALPDAKTPFGILHFATDGITLGLTADHTLFDAQVAHFSHTYLCIVRDAPAHGGSCPYPLDFSLDDYALILHDILAKENVSSLIIQLETTG